MPPNEDTSGDVLREHHADLASIKQAQRDINRRLASLETKQDNFLSKVTEQAIVENRVAELEATVDEMGDTKKEMLRWAIQIAIGSVLLAIGSKVGLEVFLPG